MYKNRVLIRGERELHKVIISLEREGQYKRICLKSHI